MKITFNSADLRGAIARAGKIDDKSAPWSGTVLLDASPSGVTIRACDYISSAAIPLDATADGSAKIGMDLRALDTLARRYDTVTIHATPGERRVELQAGSSKVGVITLDPDTYPSERPLPETAIALDGIHDAIRRIGGMVMNDQTRAGLCGLRVHYGESGAAYVATDGHRAALIGDRDLLTGPGITIPLGLLDAIKATEGTVSCGADESVICVRVGSTIYVHSAIPETFPDVSQVMPARHDDPVECDPEALIAAIRSALALGSKKTGTVRFEIGDREIRLHSRDNDRGTEYLETVACDGDASGAFALNGTYAIDAIKALGCARFGFSGDTNPVLFVSEDAECVVMPMRL